MFSHKTKYIFTILFIALFNFQKLCGQDLRSGEITYKNIAGYIYQLDVYLYQDLTNFVDRTYILVDWGVGVKDTMQRIDTIMNNTDGIILAHYSGNFTYPGPGVFIISYIDSFLVSNITNISNSSNEPLCLQDTFIINVFAGINNSPLFSNLQDVGWNNCSKIFNNGAYDSDGDSLSYSLELLCTSNYYSPNGASINSIGDFTMCPLSTGKYAIAIHIREWRKFGNLYTNIGVIKRQMLFNVDSVSSTNENDFSSQYSIHPNPAHSELNISVNDNKKYTCSIKNILGQTLAEKSFTGNISFDVRNWAKGMYFVELRDEKGMRMRTEKVIVE